MKGFFANCNIHGMLASILAKVEGLNVETKPEEKSWNPLTGPRKFRSGNAAWEGYGKYRFSISQRTFLTWIGKKKACPPRADGFCYVEDIEIFSESKGWPPAPAFAGPYQKGGEGEASEEMIRSGEMRERERALRERIAREKEQILLDKMKGELLPRADFEQQLAAAAVAVSTAAESWAYDKAREIIHICEGNAALEDKVREYLLHEVRAWLNAFSLPRDYLIELRPQDEQSDFDAGFEDENVAALGAAPVERV